MATTTYVIQNVAGTEIGTRSNKAKAAEFAQAHRAETGEGVQVLTSKGTVVLEIKGKRTMKRTKPYTRVVALPDEVQVPEGFRVAYNRPRRGVAVLHDIHEGYRLLNTVTSELSEDVFETTRDAGKAMLSITK